MRQTIGLYRAMRILIAATLLLVSAFSCGKSTPRITPRFPVWLEISLNSDRELLAPGGMKRFLRPRLHGEQVGFAGVLVVRSLLDDAFYAYDLACPNENSPNVRLELGDLNARCPKCHSEFDVLSGNGIPLSGTAPSPLRSYRTNYNSRERMLYITN